MIGISKKELLNALYLLYDGGVLTDDQYNDIENKIKEAD